MLGNRAQAHDTVKRSRGVLAAALHNSSFMRVTLRASRQGRVAVLLRAEAGEEDNVGIVESGAGDGDLLAIARPGKRGDVGRLVVEMHEAERLAFVKRLNEQIFRVLSEH